MKIFCGILLSLNFLQLQNQLCSHEKSFQMSSNSTFAVCAVRSSESEAGTASLPSNPPHNFTLVVISCGINPEMSQSLQSSLLMFAIRFLLLFSLLRRGCHVTCLLFLTGFWQRLQTHAALLLGIYYKNVQIVQPTFKMTEMKGTLHFHLALIINVDTEAANIKTGVMKLTGRRKQNRSPWNSLSSKKWHVEDISEKLCAAGVWQKLHERERDSFQNWTWAGENIFILVVTGLAGRISIVLVDPFPHKLQPIIQKYCVYAGLKLDSSAFISSH